MGYYTNIYGKCDQIESKNCLEIKNAEECSVCDDKLLAEDGKCDLKNQKTCGTEHCDLCKLDQKTG